MKIRWGTYALALLGILWFTASSVMQKHDDYFTEEGLLEADAKDLRQTIVTAHPNVALKRDQNVIWCATFQLAWNEVCDLVEEDLHFSGTDPEMVASLNERCFTKESMDTECYVAIADFVRNDVFGEIARELETTFQGQATPHYVPPQGLTPRPQDIVAYSYLFKNLEFAIPFERIKGPLWFADGTVPCFGIGDEYKEQHLKMLDQLDILDYQGEDDFIVELKTKSRQDQLILAKVQPAETLNMTIESVLARAANAEPTPALAGDILKVPKLNFDITRRYSELEGKRLVVQNPQVASDLRVLSALQNIRLQLDEEGVRLRSESHISFGCGGPVPLSMRHNMVFNKPFLMMLKRRDAEVPFLAIWIETPEILVGGSLTEDK